MIPKAELIRDKPEVRNEYRALAERKSEIEGLLAAANREIDHILGGLGELVASGSKYTKPVARLEALRHETEALGSGIRYLENHMDLICRMNPWLRSR